MYPSAISAQHATPREHRVYDLDKVTRGMVAYFDDINDSNPYGHIVTVAGRNKNGELLVWSNDVAGAGKVAKVRASFFPNYWGDRFMFGATWLNGVALDLPEKKAPEPPKKERFQLLDEAIESVKKAYALNKERDNVRVANALKRDLRELQETKKRFS